MRWGIWSVAGEALNFGGRRMETIMRVAWLPVILLLLVQMVTVFLTLSIALQAPISFAETTTYGTALGAYPEFAAFAWQTQTTKMIWLTAGSFAITLLIVSSFMAPLIRYAATGIKPAPGLIRLPFGAEQVRFSISALLSGLVSVTVLFAPLMAAINAINGFVARTVILTKIEDHVKFPFGESIHSVYDTRIGDLIVGSGKWWIFGIPVSLLVLSVPLFLIFVGLMVRHFHPKSRPEMVRKHETGNIALQSAAVTVGSLLFFGVIWFLLTGVAGRPAFLSGLIPLVSEPLRQFTWFALILTGIIGYFSMRLFAWPGFTVMDRSMSIRDSLLASRGWNLFRIIALFLMVFVITFVMQFVINLVLNSVVFPALLQVYGMLITGTRTLNSGVTAEWVPSAIIWFWNIIRLVVNIFWLLFSYGVLAGLYGRLYARVTAAKPYMPS